MVDHIFNINTPYFLLSLDLKTLEQLYCVNHHLYNIIKSDTFWYLKIENDYPDIVNKWKNKCDYLGRIVFQHIYQNSFDCYMFYHYYYNHDHDHKENNIYIFRSIIQKYNKNFSQLSQVLTIISLSYNDSTLELRMKKHGKELLSPHIVISSLFQKDLNIQHYIKDGIWLNPTYYLLLSVTELENIIKNMPVNWQNIYNYPKF